jgi:hypothetical protein
MEIYEKFGRNGMLSIPHYAIVNKEGELQFPSAASPEDMDKLTEQLKKPLNKRLLTNTKAHRNITKTGDSTNLLIFMDSIP